MASGRDKILNGFHLNSDTLWEMRRLLERRPLHKFSDGLSDEAKLVINQLKEESKTNTTPVNNNTENNTDFNRDRRLSRAKLTKTKTQAKKNQVSYVDSIQKSALRLDRDITDPNFSETDQRKRALCGGPVHCAMETIEIVDAANPTDNTEDDFAIEQTAKHNSVEKCIVWMEVNDNVNIESVSGSVPE